MGYGKQIVLMGYVTGNRKTENIEGIATHKDMIRYKIIGKRKNKQCDYE